MTSSTEERILCDHTSPEPVALTITLEIGVGVALAMLAIERESTTELEAARLIASALEVTP